MTDTTYAPPPVSLPSAPLQPLPVSSPTQRRRSAILRPPPPSAPPPNQPIPSIPALDNILPDVNSQTAFRNDTFLPEASGSTYFSRPVPSPNLVSVATFSQNQARQLSSTQASPSMTTQLGSSTAQPMGQGSAADRLLLSPSDPASRTSDQRPSSRRTLTRALELAREAVRLDSTNDDPYGAIVAYGKSVALLSRVMERVMRGDESSDRRRGDRRRSVVAQEEEIKRLKAIHDTYADRMNILSLIYDIPPVPQSPTSLYNTASVSASTSTTSTRPPSPTYSPPIAESDSQSAPHDYPTTDEDDESRERRFSTETAKFYGDLVTNGYSAVHEESGLPYHHPYATTTQSSASDDERLNQANPSTPSALPTTSQIRTPNPSRLSRPRAASNLPPPPPPPQNALPPAPDQIHVSPNQHPTPARVHGTMPSGHTRNLSGSKLESLREHEEAPSQTSQKSRFDTTGAARSDVQPTAHESNVDPHPLPPLPTSPQLEQSTSDMLTPRSQAVELDGPSARSFTQRARGMSTYTQSEPSTANLINANPNMGTISLRRSKASAPSSPGGSPRLADAIPTPALKVPSGLVGRGRANSQPGNRPVLANPPPYEMPSRPSSSISGLPSGSMPRKQSVSVKPPVPGLPQIQVFNGALSPPPSTPALSLATQLVPPPPIPHGNLPTTPTSPLPPAAPTDALRKPYHMMSLLRHTMTSKSGGYITRRLHIPHGVWSQGGAKLQNLPEKVRVVEYLCSALEELQKVSGDAFGHGNVSTGMGLGIGSVGKKEGDMWSAKLEEFSALCDGVVANFGKKLGVGEGFVTKKSGGVTSWGGKLTRQLDKLTNQKSLDSPASYVQALNRLFLSAQLLDEHCKAITMQPLAPTYAALPIDTRMSVENRLRRSSEFFASVVLTFVVRDLAQLLDKYVKRCEKWLAE